jgi:hypothetical protein
MRGKPRYGSPRRMDVLQSKPWAVSSMAEQVPFKHKVEGSTPPRPIKRSTLKSPLASGLIRPRSVVANPFSSQVFGCRLSNLVFGQPFVIQQANTR